MEQKFKVGDRVRHLKHGFGTVEQVSPDNFRCHIKLDDDGETINVLSDFIELIDTATNDPSPSRAMIAAMALQGLFAKEQFNVEQADWVASVAVKYADALIAELQKPKP
jgi:hypothetical protein